MAIDYQRIIIVKQNRPISKNVNEELQWFGSSFGLFNLRDKDKSCFRIFIELVKKAKVHEAVSSDALAENLKLTRGTVVHHLARLMDSGLVVSKKNRYALRVGNLEILINEVQKDMKRAFEDLRDVAKEIDEWLEL